MANISKTPVSRRALVQRINRALSHQNERIRACRADSRWYVELGDFYQVDFGRNTIVGKHVDLEGLGRELGVLKAYEGMRG